MCCALVGFSNFFFGTRCEEFERRSGGRGGGGFGVGRGGGGGGRCLRRRENVLTVGPNFKYFRLLKVLVITDSQVPNMGTRTLWGLSGLRVLDLSRNRLTAVVDKNFDGLYSLKEVYLDGNLIRSMISAAFRHITQLEILSLRDNRISGTKSKLNRV